MNHENTIIPSKRSESKLLGIFKKILKMRETSIAIPVILLILIIGIINPVFFSGAVMISIIRSASFTFIIAIAMTFVLIAAGLDLSVGSVVALGGVLTGLLLKTGLAVPLCLGLGILVGVSVGLLNGSLIVFFKIPPLIVTLGMMYMAKGVVLILTKGQPVYPLPDSFNRIGQGDFFGFPYVSLIAIVLALIAHIVLTSTRFGRSVMAIGGNEETSKLSGITVKHTKILVYVLTGAASTLAGMLMAGRLGSAQASSGAGYEMKVIAAVIIGGTSLFGGVGSILGTLIGTMLMAVIANGMVMLKISAYWQNLVIGAIIIIAVGMDQLKRRS